MCFLTTVAWSIWVRIRNPPQRPIWRSWPDRREALTDYYHIRELSREDILLLLDDYDERGWDVRTGIPGKGKVAQLGLEDFLPLLAA